MANSEAWWLCAALAASLVFYLATSRRTQGGRPLPPGPTPLPLIGNLLSLGGTFHQTLAKLAGVHGPVMLLKLGLSNMVVISSRDAAREAYTKHDQRLAAHAVPDSFRARGFSEYSMGFMQSSDPQWKSLRGIQATHIFSPRSLEAVRGIRERKVGEIVGYFRKHAGKEVLFREVVYMGMLNLLSNTFFSIDMADMGSKSAHGLQHLVEDIIDRVSRPNVSDFFPFLRRLDLQGLRRQTGKCLDSAYSILDGIIDRRLEHNRAGKDEHGDYLDALLKLMSDAKISRYQVRQMLFDVFVAGADTVSATVEWVMAELLHNPSAMAKVRAEVTDALGGKEAVEESDAARLTYLQCTLKEVMRLHPVGPILIPHFAAEDSVEVSGYTVPKGSTVIFNAWAIMRDPAAWERPDEFLPERFLQRSPQPDYRGKDYEFIPFGSGRRLCPGLPMAERLVPYIVVSLLHAFDWQLPGSMAAEEMDMTERFSTVNLLAVPLKAVPLEAAR
ncbi:hypothetical protein ABZP36_032725 [Zizania latifolia]